MCARAHAQQVPRRSAVEKHSTDYSLVVAEVFMWGETGWKVFFFGGVFFFFALVQNYKTENIKPGPTVKYSSILYLDQIPGPELSCADSVQSVVKLCPHHW